MAKSNSTPRTRRVASHVCGERRIKVHQTHYDYKPKRDTNSYRVNRAVPWVQLKGYWLEAVGFNIDTRIQVRVMKGCLVLTVVTEQEQE